jgi:hypothetical protein
MRKHAGFVWSYKSKCKEQTFIKSKKNRSITVELHEYDRYFSSSINNVTLEQNWMCKISHRLYRILHFKMLRKNPREESSTHLHTTNKGRIQRNTNCSYVHKAEVSLERSLSMEREHMHFIKFTLPCIECFFSNLKATIKTCIDFYVLLKSKDIHSNSRKLSQQIEVQMTYISNLSLSLSLSGILYRIN